MILQKLPLHSIKTRSNTAQIYPSPSSRLPHQPPISPLLLSTRPRMSISPYRKTIADLPFISVLLRRTNIPHRINAPAGCICSGSPFSPVYMPIISLSDLQERAHFRGIRRTNRSSVRNRRVPRQNRRQPLFTAPSDSTDCMSTRRNRLRGFPTHSQHATKERTGETYSVKRESRVE